MRRFLVLLLVTVLAVTGSFMMITFVTQFLLETAGFPDQYLSVLLLGQGTVGVVTTILTGQVLDKRPWQAMLVALGLLTGSLVWLWGLGHVPALALVGLALFGLALSAIPPALSFLSMQFAPGATESATAISSSVFNLGIGGGAASGHWWSPRPASARCPSSGRCSCWPRWWSSRSTCGRRRDALPGRTYSATPLRLPLTGSSGADDALEGAVVELVPGLLGRVESGVPVLRLVVGHADELLELGVAPLVELLRHGLVARILSAFMTSSA